jgi:hypothetical protein
MKKFFLSSLALVCFSGASLLHGSTLLFTTPPNSTLNGQSVDASALFNFSNGSFTLTLTNLGVTNDAGQLLSDLLFNLSTGGPITFAGMTSHTVDVQTNGSVANVNTADSTIHWGFGTDSGNGEFLLCAVCGAGVTSPSQPKYEILGQGGGSGSTPYSTSNASIKGGGGDSHEPFILDSATFTFTGSSITTNTTLSNVFFSFGSEFGTEVGGTPGGQAPEPLPVILTGAGLLALGGLRRFRKTA